LSNGNTFLFRLVDHQDFFINHNVYLEIEAVTFNHNFVYSVNKSIGNTDNLANNEIPSEPYKIIDVPFDGDFIRIANMFLTWSDTLSTSSSGTRIVDVNINDLNVIQVNNHRMLLNQDVNDSLYFIYKYNIDCSRNFIVDTFDPFSTTEDESNYFLTFNLSGGTADTIGLIDLYFYKECFVDGIKLYSGNDHLHDLDFTSTGKFINRYTNRYQITTYNEHKMFNKVGNSLKNLRVIVSIDKREIDLYKLLLTTRIRKTIYLFNTEARRTLSGQ
jgi:hypothetical protein